MSKIIVGIAAGRKYENYLQWIMQVPDVEVIKFSHDQNNAFRVKECHGVVLTGGEDVHPKFYNKIEYVDEYKLFDFNIARDEFELELLANSRDSKIPLLGICRGLQIANVFYGGTLIPDIQSVGKPDHTKYEEGKDRYHLVKTIKNSFLESIAGKTGEINSAHHQSVDQPAAELVINAYSEDGVVEGMERKIKDSKPYLLLVQWHPERMINSTDSFSRNIRNSFFESIQ